MIPDTALYHERSHTIMVIYAYMYMYKISHYTCNMCQSRRLQNQVLMQVGGTMLLKESLVNITHACMKAQSFTAVMCCLASILSCKVTTPQTCAAHQLSMLLT